MRPRASQFCGVVNRHRREFSPENVQPKGCGLEKC
jgi:hypothetical protein